jgi:hypothetical protein
MPKSENKTVELARAGDVYRDSNLSDLHLGLSLTACHGGRHYFFTSFL